MTHAPTLGPDRLQQLRTFLTTEAAADLATSTATDGARSPRHSLVATHRRLALGVALALTLGGAMVASTVRPDGADAALAITTQSGWTTVRLLDIDADPQAVVDELVAAGIDARVARLDGGTTTDPGYLIGTVDETSSRFLYGLSVTFPGAPPGTDPSGAEDVRFSDDGESLSFRSDADAVVLVHPRP
jgi:hypothetical protein